MDDLRAELEQALALEDETERKLAVAAVVNQAVRPLGFRAVVIGGLAVEFWTRGEYTTADIDLYLPWTPGVDTALAAVGFVKHGRHWTLPEHDVFVEAPASVPAAGEEVREVIVAADYVALVLALEDVILDRLHQFVAGGYRDVASQSIALLAADDVDERRLDSRASDERLGSALEAMRELARRAEDGETIETWELKEIARRLQRER